MCNSELEPWQQWPQWSSSMVPKRRHKTFARTPHALEVLVEEVLVVHATRT